MNFKHLRRFLEITQDDIYKCLGVSKRQVQWKIQVMDRNFNNFTSEELAKMHKLFSERLAVKKTQIEDQMIKLFASDDI